MLVQNNAGSGPSPANLATCPDSAMIKVEPEKPEFRVPACFYPHPRRYKVRPWTGKEIKGCTVIRGIKTEILEPKMERKADGSIHKVYKYFWPAVEKKQRA